MESCARAVIAACILSAVCGCGSLRQWAGNGFKVGPNYQKPAAPVAAEWIDLGQDDRISCDEPDLAAWWQTFNDPVLDELIATTYGRCGKRGLESCRPKPSVGLPRATSFHNSSRLLVRTTACRSVARQRIQRR